MGGGARAALASTVVMASACALTFPDYQDGLGGNGGADGGPTTVGTAGSGTTSATSTDAGSKAMCSQDSDCASGEFCNPGTAACTARDSSGCTSNSDCTAEEACDTASGYCVFAGCMSDSECLAGKTCDSSTGVCIGTPTTEPGCKQCACMDVLAMGGCANVCKMGLNGTSTPNFCDGVNALPVCAKCLKDNCGGITNPPVATDPSACM
jgi:Cys-rich repeat protein